MLGQETQPVKGAGPEAAKEPQGQEALAEACRGVRERLETVARALASLRNEIDRTLDVTAAATGADAPRQGGGAP